MRETGGLELASTITLVLQGIIWGRVMLITLPPYNTDKNIEFVVNNL